MARDHIDFFKKQISLTEWLENIGHAESVAFREEDNSKRERLGELNKVIGLPYDKPVQFPATEVLNPTTAFKKFLKEHGEEHCAIRIVPYDPSLPKLRMRGHTIQKAIEWLKVQDLNPKDYRADFVPHIDDSDPDSSWGTIFVVNPSGVFGEITAHQHTELTQGYYQDEVPTSFSWDFATWSFSDEKPGMREHLEKVLSLIKVNDRQKQDALRQDWHATFAHDYLEGYFETTSSHSLGIWFIDYNRILGRLYKDAVGGTVGSTATAAVKGKAGSPGKASGTVRVLGDEEVQSATIKADEVLVCKMTSPEHLPLMQKAAAIVTDLGGILSHAAIIARELKKPCIVGTSNATELLKNGQKIEVNADEGTVAIL